MTKSGKCDTCRQRKVRCSENKPVCTQCRTADRPCRYTLTFGRVSKSRYINLHLSDDHESASGSTSISPAKNVSDACAVRQRPGTARVMQPSRGGLRPIREGSVSRGSQVPGLYLAGEPTTQETKLVKIWSSLVAPNGRFDSPINCFGYNIALIPEFFGRGEVMHAAVTSMVTSLLAYTDRGAESRHRTRVAYGKALEVLRKALDNQPDQRLILAATPVLVISTLAQSPSTSDWAVHVWAQYQLLDIVSNKGKVCDDIIQSIFYSCFQVSVVRPIDMAGGRDSSFDTPAWLTYPSPSDSWLANITGAGRAQKIVMQGMVRIPRLWRLMRRARLCPRDHAARHAAEKLGSELLALTLEDWVDGLFKAGTLKAADDTSMAELPGFHGISFHFPTIRVLCLLLDYWQSRILICGCIQTLCGLSPETESTDGPFDLRAVQAMEVLAAWNIMACTNEMTRVGKRSPVSRLRFCPPFMNAFSAWARLEKRELAQMLEDADGYDRHETTAEAAAQMQRRCCEQMVRCIEFWRAGVGEDEIRHFRTQLADHTEFMEGGEVSPGMKQLELDVKLCAKDLKKEGIPAHERISD